ncbi:TPR repeat-containing protein 08 [Orientia tsutsugamushi]|uniref:TPR repeat-containing protein 08 n=1 Tax=Orientia tsutsugamushi TaxID=784 RepID=A0A2U3RNA9_ORITS|nr:tetratricopeptide repeat family protein [Orientia tsutsugamushi str. Karp]SPR14578.1 TPR repeat-containing protein 08 [Orientia tsutsugamushi]
MKQLGQYQDAIKNYDIAIKYKPDSAEAYINKGVALNELGQYQEAIENFDIAIKYKPDLAEAYIRLLSKLENDVEWCYKNLI